MPQTGANLMAGAYISLGRNNLSPGLETTTCSPSSGSGSLTLTMSSLVIHGQVNHLRPRALGITAGCPSSPASLAPQRAAAAATKFDAVVAAGGSQHQWGRSPTQKKRTVALPTVKTTKLTLVTGG
ncbi:hypothetical protein QC762_0050090 [Podospora pseudocomata]|uniref:Uncharacterized protein n=1 Tax=Podospora pseudocomata TaxID=2093779 RepID=A0ABR0GIB2_9PEZI|nr:hypothetical protein QC762_0050090 [Podospora pseudocomata]